MMILSKFRVELSMVETGTDWGGRFRGDTGDVSTSTKFTCAFESVAFGLFKGFNATESFWFNIWEENTSFTRR